MAEIEDEVVDTAIVKCTNFCGFSVTGTPEYCRSLYEGHEHQEHPSTFEPNRWYDSVFSFYGFLAILVICAMIVAIINKSPSIF